MSNQKNLIHLSYWITFGLVLSFIFSVAGNCYPHQSVTQTMLFKIDALFGLAAFACLGAKATTEGYDLAAAGFNMLAISQGLFLLQIDQPGKWNYEAGITGSMFLLPALVMISYYASFPTWLRIAGVVAALPFLSFAVLWFGAEYIPTPIFGNCAYLFYQLVTVAWAVYVWKNRKQLEKY